MTDDASLLFPLCSLRLRGELGNFWTLLFRLTTRASGLTILRRKMNIAEPPGTAPPFIHVSRTVEELQMSLHHSLRAAARLVKHRNVLNKRERIERLIKEGKWTEKTVAVFNIPKVRNIKIVSKKAAKEKKEEAAVAAGAEGAAPEAAAAPAADGKAAGKGAGAPTGKGAPAEGKGAPAEGKGAPATGKGGAGAKTGGKK
jgi:small basic protein (TIGR04137 family)